MLYKSSVIEQKHFLYDNSVRLLLMMVALRIARLYRLHQNVLVSSGGGGGLVTGDGSFAAHRMVGQARMWRARMMMIKSSCWLVGGSS